MLSNWTALKFGKELTNITCLHLVCILHSLPDDKVLDWSKLKAFADDKLNVTKMIISVFDRVENIVGAISPFPTMLSKSFFP